MCGIAGFLGRPATMAAAEMASIAGRMAAAIAHRGPDDSDQWVDADAGVAFGHRRLAILDLSLQGRQPMPSACGRYVVVLNGEIYNHAELRRELEKAGNSPSWRGHSDTEVMLAAISAWGLDAAIRKFVGMFAFALWDREERMLVLARDRLGEKPLYYGWAGDCFVFASELKALRAHPQWRNEIDRNALSMLMRHNYVPAPYSIYRDIRKLPPGSVLQLRASSMAPRGLPPVQAYWSAQEVAEQGINEPFRGSDAEAIAQLDAVIRQSVRLQMVADVPLGAFLSGGIDSSTIVAAMQAQSSRPVRTFTIGFHEQGYDEAAHAHAVARHLGTDHTELYVTPEQAMAVIPRLPALYDEPFSDVSQIPTFLVSQLARTKVTVSLSGDGGDELFGGYNRYLWGQRLWSWIAPVPRPLRAVLRGALMTVSPHTWDFLGRLVRPLASGSFSVDQLGDKLHKLAELLEAENSDQVYLHLVSHWRNPAEVVPGSREFATPLNDGTHRASFPEFLRRMMFLDLVTYLPDDILVKVDRASMGVSLESRVPFLDHRVVEFAWKLPLGLKFRGGQGKWILRQVLYKYVPKKLIERPKMGFGVPIDSWLRGPLREWAEDLLNEASLRSEGYLDPAPIRRKWAEHLSGRRNWQYHLWDVLMFQAWLKQSR